MMKSRKFGNVNDSNNSILIIEPAPLAISFKLSMASL